MSRRAFITGITGQDGAYLARLLLDHGYEVHGGARRLDDVSTFRLTRLGIRNRLHLVPLDLDRAETVAAVLADCRYDEFYNLGAQSFVGTSWDEPVYTARVDGLAVAQVLDILRKTAPETRFFQASTSEIFGQVREVPQTETTALHPRSPYGVAKVFAHYITLNYRESHGLHASSGILFNHDSPLRGIDFVTRKVTRGLASIAHGGTDPVTLGNLNVERDWGHAREYVTAIWRMLQQDRADDYIIATGISTALRTFVNHAAAGLDMQLDWQGEGIAETAHDRRTGRQVIGVSPHFFRPAEVDLLVGDASKARHDLDWSPRIGVADLAAEMARADYDALAHA
jgi:GDPmannose 4,6-dehydratase